MDSQRTALLLAVAAAGFTAAIFPGPALAGRPLSTEDAGVLGQSECEIESYAGRVTGNAVSTVNTRWAQFGCGLGWTTQLALGAGPDRDETGKTMRAAFGGKTFIRELTDEQAGVTIAYALSGAREPSDRFRHDGSELKAVLSVPVDGWLLHANAGWQHSRRDRQQSTIWALAVERPEALGPVDLMAEVFGDDRSATWMQVAARWTVVPKRFFLDTSWGRQTDSARSRQITLGLKIAF